MGCRRARFIGSGNHGRERLAAPKTPRFWVFLDEFALIGSGKVRKFVLRERWAANAFQVATI